MNKAPLSVSVNTPNGLLTIYWWATTMYWPKEWIKGYVITDIHGYDFPEPYFGKLFHLSETRNGQFEYVEDIAQPNSNLDEVSRAILDAVKNATILQVQH